MDAVVNERGEKVIVGSRRPDGTIRKERRVRAGYTPQDEQPTYMSTGAMWRQGGVKCPGYDPSTDESAGSSAAKSKAAKKNEKRKVKKSEGETSSGATAAAPAAAAAAPAASQAGAALPSSSAAAEEPGSLKTGGGGGGEAAASGPALSGPAAVVDKQIKALSKKVRQCQALVVREAAGGEPLTSQEREKLDKMPGWEAEIQELQQLVQKLGITK